MALRDPIICLVLTAALTAPCYGQSEAAEVRPADREPGASAVEAGEVEAEQTTTAAVDAPLYISFQGYLEINGSPATGQHDFVFRLRDFPTAGLTKWTESQNDVEITDGIYNVLLGSVSTLANVDFNDDLWLMIEVDGGAEILPRPQIVASPYSIMSLEALDLRLPTEISGTANVDGTKLLTITNNGTGDVLEIHGENASDGIEVTGVDLNGIEVLFPGQNGVLVSGTGGIGFYASGPGSDGLFVQNAGDDGVEIQNPSDNGIVVTSAGDFAFVFQDNPDLNTGANLEAYVGIVENTGTSTSEDVIALKTGSSGDVGVAANFVGFFNNEDVLVGQIEGNGSGGVAYNTSGADYAEYLPHLSEGDTFEGGDVVGVFDGRIARRTKDAKQVMVITDSPAVLGNARKGTEDVTGLEAVSFIGQVMVRVAGPVVAGDYLVASGREDGTAIAVSPDRVSLDDVPMLIGRAWESSSDAAVKRVNAVVGLDRTEVLTEIVRRQTERVSKQQETLEELRILIEQLQREHAGS